MAGGSAFLRICNVGDDTMKTKLALAALAAGLMLLAKRRFSRLTLG